MPKLTLVTGAVVGELHCHQQLLCRQFTAVPSCTITTDVNTTAPALNIAEHEETSSAFSIVRAVVRSRLSAQALDRSRAAFTTDPCCGTSAITFNISAHGQRESIAFA